MQIEEWHLEEWHFDDFLIMSYSRIKLFTMSFCRMLFYSVIDSTVCYDLNKTLEEAQTAFKFGRPVYFTKFAFFGKL